MSEGADLVLLTGLSGFIAQHVARRLLDAGYRVRGTVRSRAKGEATRQALAGTGYDVSRLEIAEADLAREAGWDEAVAGCRYVQHTASPFPARMPRDRLALVPEAREGTRRVVEAAMRAGVERLVLTSSVVAVYHGHPAPRRMSYTEADFSDADGEAISSYAISKTLAERAAWSLAEGEKMEMSVLNPSLVLGPLLGREPGTSLSIVAMMMRGLLPIVPNARFGIVDVRDVAGAHVKAMTLPDAAGRRFILTSGPRSLMEIGAELARLYPTLKRLPRFTIPDALVLGAARFSRRAAALAAELDPNRRLDNSAARDVLGIRFRKPEEAIEAAARSLVGCGVVAPPPTTRDGMAARSN